MLLFLACLSTVIAIWAIVVFVVASLYHGGILVGDITACGQVMPQGASVDVSPAKPAKRERVDVQSAHRPDHSYIRTIEIDARFADVDLVKLVKPVGEPNKQWQMVLASKRMPLAQAQALVAKGMHKPSQQFCRITRIS